MAALAGGGCADAERQGPAPSLPTWMVPVEAVVEVGRLDGDPDYVLADVRDVKLLPGGGLAVVDGQSASIRTYGPDGRIVRSTGRAGQGPGEFDYVQRVFPGDDQSLVAFDAGLGRLTALSADGAVIGTTTLRADSGWPQIYVPLERGGHLGAWIDQGLDREASLSADRWPVALFDSAGSPVREVASFEGFRRVRLARSSRPAPFSPRAMAVPWRGGAALSDGVGGRIVVLEGDGLAPRTLTVGLEAPEVQAAYAVLASLVDSAAARQLEEARAVPGTDTVPAFSDMLVDDTGRLWLKPFDPRTDNFWVFPVRRTGGTWLVVDDGGASVARVEIPDDLVLMDVRGDRVAGVAYDAMGVERVRVHRLTR